MNELSNKKNITPHVTGDEPIAEAIEVDKTIRVFTVSVIIVGICLAVMGIFFMSCGLFHVNSVGEALLTFNSNLFS